MQEGGALDAEIVQINSARNMYMRDNSQRARIALIMLWVVLGSSCLLIISSVLQLMLLNSEGGYTMEEAEMNDLRHKSLAWLRVAAYITCTVFFIMWFRRAYYNLGAIGIVKGFTDGWAAGAWFVPFVNLGRPARIMHEIWDEYSLTLEKLDPQLRILNNGRIMIGIWWAAWLIWGLLSRIEYNLSGSAYTIDQWITATNVGIASEMLCLLTGLLAVTIVKRVRTMEQELYARQALLSPVPIV